jgi:hypothetical protein
MVALAAVWEVLFQVRLQTDSPRAAEVPLEQANLELATPATMALPAGS